jgi:hypothetical protein
MRSGKISLLLVFFAALPLFAQDDAPGGALSGGSGAQVFTRVDAVNPMDQVNAFLARANVTLSSDQEKTLRPAVEAAVKQLREISDRSGAGRGGRGERKGAGTAGQGAPVNGAAAEEIKKMNDDLLARITVVLKPDQQAAFKKFQNNEIKKAGGFGALKIVMEEAGASLSSEQEPEIQSIYNDAAQQRVQLLRESQGNPAPARLADLQKATMAKVVKVLTPAQRKALLDSRTKPQ